jgi:CrcB protein
MLWVSVAVAGGLGSTLRFLIDGQVARRTRTAFPFGTLAVNISGAVVLGFLSGLVLRADIALIAATALVGSYTTFSTWMFETQRLAEERQLAAAAGDIVVSLVLGVGAAALGRMIGTRI